MDDIISEFLVNTCQVKSQLNAVKLEVWLLRQTNASLTLVGSAGDVFIESLMEPPTDVDIMDGGNERLAVQTVQQIPKELSPTYSNTVTVYEMVDTNFADYFELLKVGHLNRKQSGYEYKFTPAFSGTMLGYAVPPSSDVCGRGIQRAFLHTGYQHILNVHSVRCFAWPTRASHWPVRPRKYEWPDAATIKCVVDSGCDLVQDIQRQLHQGEFPDGHHWKLLFARAETLLLNTWTPRQQLVYQILRVILKKSGLCTMTDHNGDDMLTTYHAKTVMMWNCELKPVEWWTKSNVIQLSRNMMQILLNCCMSSRCDGYFITASNLLEYAVPQSVKSRLQSFTDVTFLTQYLIYNGLCGADDCPNKVQCLFHDISSRNKMLLALNAYHKWKQQKMLRESLSLMVQILRWLCVAVRKRSSTLDGSVIRKWRKDFSEIDQRLVHSYLTAIFCLSLLSRTKVTSNVVDAAVLDALTVALTNHDWSVVTSTAKTSCISLMQKAVYLLRLCRNTNNTWSSTLMLLSFTYLQKINYNKESYGDSIMSLSAVYLSVLYYITGQYKKVINVCGCLVRSYADQSQHIPCVAEGECMPKINDDVDNVLGLTVLYQYVNVKFFSRDSYAVHVNVLSAHLFAHYLMLESRRYLNTSNGSVKRKMMKQYKSDFCRTQHPFIADLMLLYVSCEKRPDQDVQVSRSTELNPLRFKSRELSRLLTAISVEHLTSFHRILSQEFISLGEIAMTDFESMHLYTCGMYERSLQLSKRNFSQLISQTVHLDVPMMGCMTHLMDENLAALLGVIGMVTRDETASISQAFLSLYLILSSALKLSMRRTSAMTDLPQLIRLVYGVKVSGSDNPVNSLVLSFVYRKAIVGLSRSLKS